MAVHFLMGSYVHSNGFLAWGLLAIAGCIAQELCVRGLRKQRSWAWMLATVFGLVNLWIGINSLVSFPDVRASDFARQIGVVGITFYFLLSGSIILFGLYLGKGSESE